MSAQKHRIICLCFCALNLLYFINLHLPFLGDASQEPNFIDTTNQKSTCTINLDNEKKERFNIGQKIYFIKNEKAELYFEDVYYGNVIYRGTNSRGVTAQNIQFKIDSGFIYTFNIKLAHYFRNFSMGLDTDRLKEK